MAQLLPRFVDLDVIRGEAREAPGIDGIPERSVDVFGDPGGDALRLRGIPAIGAAAGAIRGTNPQQALDRKEAGRTAGSVRSLNRQRWPR